MAIVYECLPNLISHLNASQRALQKLQTPAPLLHTSQSRILGSVSLRTLTGSSAVILTPHWKADSLKRKCGIERTVFSGENIGRKCKGFFSLYSTNHLSQVFHLSVGKSTSSPKLRSHHREGRWIQQQWWTNDHSYSNLQQPEGQQVMQPQNMPLGAEGIWKIANAGGSFLWTPLTCLKKSLQKESGCFRSHPGSFINQRRVTLVTRGTRSQHHSPEKLCPKLFYLPSITLRAHLCFL